MVKVFKFGGASVNSAKAIQNVGDILMRYSGQKIVLILSAMDKTTNALELLADSYFNRMSSTARIFNKIKHFHMSICEDLCARQNTDYSNDLSMLFDDLEALLGEKPSENFDYEYDRIVSYGELFSTVILFQYLKSRGFNVAWMDVRELIVTDGKYRRAAVDWERSPQYIQRFCESLFQQYDLLISQGFIARSADGESTTLGREGSDFSAAIFAYSLDAEDLTIWKDVPGLLNADPKYFSNTQKLDKVSFKETIELAYYGASIIHPKTIKPLKNKNIPLYIKSFLEPDSEGSVIQENTKNDRLIPSYIFKRNQVLISISPRDFSFIAERNLALIFARLAKYGLSVNMMQNSAISFSICIDEGGESMISFIESLQKDFNVRYNRDLELITIRHYNQQIIDDLIGSRKVYLEQKSRSTVQLLVR